MAAETGTACPTRRSSILDHADPTSRSTRPPRSTSGGGQRQRRAPRAAVGAKCSRAPRDGRRGGDQPDVEADAIATPPRTAHGAGARPTLREHDRSPAAGDLTGQESTPPPPRAVGGPAEPRRGPTGPRGWAHRRAWGPGRRGRCRGCRGRRDQRSAVRGRPGRRQPARRQRRLAADANLAAPINGAVAANANVAAPIDAAVAASRWRQRGRRPAADAVITRLEGRPRRPPTSSDSRPGRPR